MAERMLPFRDLLKSATPFCWNNNLDQLLEESKSAITTEIASGMKIFNLTKLIQYALQHNGLEMALAFKFFTNIVSINWIFLLSIQMENHLNE